MRCKELTPNLISTLLRARATQQIKVFFILEGLMTIALPV